MWRNLQWSLFWIMLNCVTSAGVELISTNFHFSWDSLQTSENHSETERCGFDKETSCLKKLEEQVLQTVTVCVIHTGRPSRCTRFCYHKLTSTCGPKMKVFKACTFSQFGGLFFWGNWLRGGELALLRWISGDQSFVGGGCAAKHVPVNTTPPDFLGVRLAWDYDNNIYWWDP